MSVLAGIFVGGAGARLGGAAKGMLAASGGGTLVDRWLRLLGDLAIPAVLVGEHPAYAALDLERVGDDPPAIGPLGGLVGLLRRAGSGRALALACDMPFVSRDLLERLLGFAPGAAIVAARRDRLWEPLCAVYAAPLVLPVAVARAARGARSLQGLLDDVGATELPIDQAQAAELADWDTPDNL